MRLMKVGLSVATSLLVAQMAMADSGKTPTVVEMFTSKYCPNCPGAEHKLKGEAEANADLLVIFEHVDYWDSDDKKDPYGLADITQRQYDVSGAMGMRQGEVFTPMPLLDGQILANPPLLFSWNNALKKARELPEKPRLDVSKAADGSLDVKIPAALYGANREVWVLGVEQVDDTKAWVVRGIAQANVKDGLARVAGPNLPKTSKFVVLLQDSGPGKVVAMGSLGLQN